MKRTQPLFITTQEKFHKDRSDRRKPGFLVSQIKEKNITARSQFESSPGLWKSRPFLDIPKPTFKRSFKTQTRTTPKVSSAKVSMEQKMDFEKYRAILRGEGPYLYTVRDQKSPSRTPIFRRSQKSGSHSPAAIERYVMYHLI